MYHPNLFCCNHFLMHHLHLKLLRAFSFVIAKCISLQIHLLAFAWIYCCTVDPRGKLRHLLQSLTSLQGGPPGGPDCGRCKAVLLMVFTTYSASLPVDGRLQKLMPWQNQFVPAACSWTFFRSKNRSVEARRWPSLGVFHVILPFRRMETYVPNPCLIYRHVVSVAGFAKFIFILPFFNLVPCNGPLKWKASKKQLSEKQNFKMVP